MTTTAPATIESVTTTVASATTTPTTFSEATTVAPTTTETPVATTVPGSLSALDVLAFTSVENEHCTGYDRDLFGYPTDADGDDCNTREEVLIRDSLSPAQVDPSGCIVADDPESDLATAIASVSSAFQLAKWHLLGGGDEYTKDDERLVQDAVDAFELEAVKMGVQA